MVLSVWCGCRYAKRFTPDDDPMRRGNPTSNLTERLVVNVKK